MEWNKENQDATQGYQTDMRDRKALAIAILALLGLIDSVETYYIYLKLIKTNFAYSSFCAVSEFVNCDTVLASRYGKILGVHNSVYAILTYSAIFIFSIIYYLKTVPSGKRYFSYMYWVSLFTSALSVYLFYVSLFSIKALCIMCVALYLINLTMLGISIAGVWREKVSPAILLDDGIYIFRNYTVYAVAVLALSVSGIFWLYYSSEIKEKREWRQRYADLLSGRAEVHNINIGNAPSKGDAVAKITIVEFSDFQCPYCKEADETLIRLFNEYKDVIKILFKNFPLDASCNPYIKRTSHPYACAASLAGLCAEAQGRFWELSRLMFANQSSLDAEKIMKLAEEAGLDMRKFYSCMVNPAELSGWIQRDIREGYEFGVESTPTFFINGKKASGAIPLWLFREIIEAELKRVK